ncbi:hypothetical protein L3Q82_018364 [Scortum barcoo]|uniref:Uncharacterized protein n=1 Tax=Scortum barcoo TaxID=214431 RepID=A0ACB8VIX5_9TELE|nr:hypothetical protein L3Q82_018364 [Scortum barcoo]
MWLITCIAACSICARGKASRQARMGLLQPLPVPQRPWSHLTLDFITGLPPSKGNTTVLTVVDRFSKMAHFIPLPKLPSAKETAQVMINHVFRIHGLPTDIVSRTEVRSLSLFFGSQPVLWISSPGIQRPDGAHEPGAGDLPAMPCSPEPDNMEPTPDLDRLPRSLQVHPSFHVSKIKPVKESLLVPPTKPPPPPKLIDGGPVYAVKKLLAVRKRGRGHQFFWSTGRGMVRKNGPGSRPVSLWIGRSLMTFTSAILSNLGRRERGVGRP